MISTRGISPPENEPRLRRLFFILAVLYVLPFWTVQYLPTTDGPCHTYNAWVFRNHGNQEEFPLFHQYYELNLRPYPNWTGHAVMTALMYAVPPLIAEKLLVSGYVLLFLGGAWYLAGAVHPGERWPAFLAFPFAYNQLFQFGFYNFSIGVAVFFFVLGFWWRRREKPDLQFAVGINLLLGLCWFSHVLPFVLALLCIAVLWLATLRRASWRRHLLHVLILAPQVVLPLWFLQMQGTSTYMEVRSFLGLLWYLMPPRVLVTLGGFQFYLALVVAAAFLIFLFLTLWRRFREEAGQRGIRETDAFPVLAAGVLALYFFGPEGMAGGTVITARLALMAYLLLIPCLSPRLSGRAREIAVGVLALTALVNLGYLVRTYVVLGEEVRRFVAGLEPVRPSSRVLSLLFSRGFAERPTDIFSHATAYKALEKGLIDWDNYEAKVSFFPVRFRPGVRFPKIEEVAAAPWTFRPRINRRHIDAVYLWQIGQGSPLQRLLKRDYVRTWKGYGGELYESRALRRPTGERASPRSEALGVKPGSPNRTGLRLSPKSLCLPAEPAWLRRRARESGVRGRPRAGPACTPAVPAAVPAAGPPWSAVQE